MRIGVLCPYSFDLPGGVQNHVLGLSNWLSGAGHQVAVLGPGRPSPQMLAQHGLDPRVFTSAGRAWPIPINGSVARVNCGPHVSRQVARWLADGQFDLVHLHEPIAPTAALHGLRRAQMPVVATFHAATRAWWRAGRLVRQSVTGLTERLNATIAVSDAAAHTARHYLGVEPVVVANGIAVRDHPCAATASRWRNGDRPLCLFLGRFDEPRKGFSTLLSALPRVRAGHPDLEVVVAGSGRVPTIPGVRFVGAVPDQERNRLLGRADVFVAPHTGQESFGIVLLEALACGAPVVASDLAAFRAVLSDDAGLVGHVFRRGDSADLARAMLVSLAEPRDLLRLRGRALAASYDWSVVGRQLLGVYHAAIERHSVGCGTGSSASRAV